MKEHVNIEHLDRRIRCGCGQEFKWRSAFARHKTKCLMFQFSVTDPNPQRKKGKVKSKNNLTKLLTTRKLTENSKSDTKSDLPESGDGMNNLQTNTADVGMQPNRDSSHLLEKCKDLLNKGKEASKASPLGNGQGHLTGALVDQVSQYVPNSIQTQQIFPSHSNQNSGISFQLVAAAETQMFGGQSQSLGSTTSRLTSGQIPVRLQPNTAPQITFQPGHSSAVTGSQVVTDLGISSLVRQVVSSQNVNNTQMESVYSRTHNETNR